mgnify:CR=1 FL=1
MTHRLNQASMSKISYMYSSLALRSILEPSRHLIRALRADQFLILAARRDTVALLTIPRAALIIEAELALSSDTAALAELATVGGISHTESCICRQQLGIRILWSLLHVDFTEHIVRALPDHFHGG